MNRQPKNIKIPNADLKELTIQISGFDTLENNDVGRYFTCSGTVELVNTLGNGEEKRFVLAEPKIKVNVVKKVIYRKQNKLNNWFVMRGWMHLVMVAKTLTNLTTMKMKLGLNASKVALLVSLY